MAQGVRTLAAIVLAGIVFFYVDSYLVGFAAAVAYPDWFAKFVASYPRLGFAIWDTVLIVPITVAVSIAIGAVLAKAISRRYFVSGLAAILVAIVVATSTATTDQTWLLTLRNHALPLYIFQAPLFLAIWLALPFSVYYFGNRGKSA